MFATCHHYSTEATWNEYCITCGVRHAPFRIYWYSFRMDDKGVPAKDYCGYNWQNERNQEYLRPEAAGEHEAGPHGLASFFVLQSLRRIRTSGFVFAKIISMRP